MLWVLQWGRESSRGLLDLFHDGLELVTDLIGVGIQEAGEFVKATLEGSAQIVSGLLQLLLQSVGLLLQLLAHTLVLQHFSEGDQLLADIILHLLYIGLKVGLYCLSILPSTGLKLTQVSGHSATKIATIKELIKGN